jgi:hypothetical protein
MLCHGKTYHSGRNELTDRIEFNVQLGPADHVAPGPMGRVPADRETKLFCEGSSRHEHSHVDHVRHTVIVLAW